LRENFSSRLALAVTPVGSVNAISELVGVNRTQFSRYLSGKSMPRPEILYHLSMRLDVPMEWFFTPITETISKTSVLKFGTSMGELVRGRNFEMSDDVLPDGFYLLWKGMFSQKHMAEAFICRVTKASGIKQIKMCVRRSLAKDEIVEGLSSKERFQNGVVIKSSERALILFSESKFNIISAGYLQKAYLTQSYGVD
jgi:transcriptional regulator with XRE-family HTH domain